MAQVEIVRAVMAEKFVAVDGRFEESKVAVDAAFAAAKEAVAEQNKSNSASIGKAEANNKEQLASLSRVTDAGLAGLADKIDDARTRLTSLESRTAGIQQGTGAARDYRAEVRDTETLTAVLRQAAVASPLRLNLTATFSGLAVLISMIVLILSLTTGHL